jgi:hypothetical protein
MSSTGAREQAGEPAVPEQAGPGRAEERAREAVPARAGGHVLGGHAGDVPRPGWRWPGTGGAGAAG